MDPRGEKHGQRSDDDSRAPVCGQFGRGRRWALIALGAGLIHVGLAVDAARLETPTIDEFAHVPAGCAYWKHDRLDLYSKNPPLLKYWLTVPLALDAEVAVPLPTEQPFGWGPWDYGTRFMEANWNRYLSLFFRARMMVIPLSLATAVLLYLWAMELFGGFAASMVTALFLLSPNILAHGHLATIDIGCMFTSLLSVYMFRRAYQRTAWWSFPVVGLLLGLALMVKFTAVILVPVLVILSLVYRGGRARSLRGSVLGRAAFDLAVVFSIALLLVNTSMAFKGSFDRLGSYSFGSSFFVRVQETLPSGFRVPLPRDYLAGLDAQKRDTERGEAGTYLMGRWSSEGWWYYFLIAFGVKMPVPFLLALPLGAVFWYRRRVGFAEGCTVLIPILVFLLFMGVFNRLTSGIRYLLVIFPFLFLVLAPLFERIGATLRHRWTRALPFGMLAYYCVAIWYVHPNYLMYFNSFAGGPEHGSEWLLDSDWGQDLYRVPEAVRRRNVKGPIRLLYFGHVDPAMYGIDYRVAPNRLMRNVVVVSVNSLKGFPYRITAPDGSSFIAGPEHLAWLGDEEPAERLGSLLLFDTRFPHDRR